MQENDYTGIPGKSQENWSKIKEILKMLEAFMENGLTPHWYVFNVGVL